MPPIRLISFGYLHLPTGPDGSPIPPAADRIEDVRDRLRDPAAARDILDLDGFHPRGQDVALATPGARELLANLTDYADIPAGPRRIAIGCAGGRHRAVDRTTEGHTGPAMGRISGVDLLARSATSSRLRRHLGPAPLWDEPASGQPRDARLGLHAFRSLSTQPGGRMNRCPSRRPPRSSCPV
ncbi:RapZ C-terminal domain-containing protein [Streptomyces hirsutus]|uniref:RapZ C-terminal domain-containing protein n=1 Tax=Streptomyces hirsutus TaxID=35620 RepID=UPI003F4CB47B